MAHLCLIELCLGCGTKNLFALADYLTSSMSPPAIVQLQEMESPGRVPATQPARVLVASNVHKVRPLPVGLMSCIGREKRVRAVKAGATAMK